MYSGFYLLSTSGNFSWNEERHFGDIPLVFQAGQQCNAILGTSEKILVLSIKNNLYSFTCDVSTPPLQCIIYFKYSNPSWTPSLLKGRYTLRWFSFNTGIWRKALRMSFEWMARLSEGLSTLGEMKWNVASRSMAPAPQLLWVWHWFLFY